MSENKLKTGLTVDDFGSPGFLAKSDLEQPTIFTITGVEKHQFDDDPWPSLILELRETRKKFVCNKINRDILQQGFGTRAIDDWVGRKLVLFVDDTVTFGGKRVGGIRARMPTKAEVDLNETAPF